MSDERTPLTVIGGYLGAGKTTLLNHLLRENRGLRLAILVNDFGEIPIDSDLVLAQDDDVITLANGCICCSLVDGLSTVLNDLRQRADIDHVVVEASGVSDPVRIANQAVAFGFEPRGVIVLADAEQVRERAENKYVGDTVIAHLRCADVIVLNKTDLLEPAALEAVRTWLGDLVPVARIVETSFGRVPTAIALGDLGRPGDEPDAHEHAHEHAHDHDHDHEYETWSFVSEEPVRREDLDAFLEALAPEVLRAKGFVHLADDPGARHLLQRVGARTTLKTLGAWGEERPATRLVLIGLPGSIDAELLERELRGADATGAGLHATSGQPHGEETTQWATS